MQAITTGDAIDIERSHSSSSKFISLFQLGHYQSSAYLKYYDMSTLGNQYPDSWDVLLSFKGILEIIRQDMTKLSVFCNQRMPIFKEIPKF